LLRQTWAIATFQDIDYAVRHHDTNPTRFLYEASVFTHNDALDIHAFAFNHGDQFRQESR